MLTSERRAAMTLTTQVSKRFGVPLPKKLAAAVTAMTETPDTTKAPATDEYGAAIAAAIAAKRDPADDAAVQRLLNRRALAQLNVGHLLAEQTELAAHDLLVEHVNHILDSWRPALDADAMVINDAHDLIGGISLGTLSKSATPTAAAAAAAARESTARLDLAVVTWLMLARVAKIACNPHRRSVVYAPLTGEQIRSLPPKVTAWDIRCAGGIIEIATWGTWVQRNEALDRADANAATSAQRDVDHRQHVAAGGFGPRPD